MVVIVFYTLYFIFISNISGVCSKRVWKINRIEMSEIAQ